MTDMSPSGPHHPHTAPQPEDVGQTKPAPGAASPGPAPKARPKMTPRAAILAGLLGVLAVLLILYAWKLPPFGGAMERTDNAYVRGQVTVISPQVSGYITEVMVKDFQAVQAGQPLFRIDDRIYRQRLEQAQASLHSAEAALANSAQSQASARGSVAQTRAAIAAAQSAVTKARADATRVRTLFEGGWVAQAQVDVAQNALRAAEAQLAETRAAEDVAQTGVTSAVVSR
ncbi:hypothetical protein LTR94_025441, partial [Friedmanniomyces endolithicus]